MSKGRGPGEPETAIETYQSALKLDPFSSEYLRKEVPAEAYFNMRRYEDSAAVLESMLKLPIFYVHQQLAMYYVSSCRSALGSHSFMPTLQKVSKSICLVYAM